MKLRLPNLNQFGSYTTEIHRVSHNDLLGSFGMKALLYKKSKHTTLKSIQFGVVDSFSIVSNPRIVYVF